MALFKSSPSSSVRPYRRKRTYTTPDLTKLHILDPPNSKHPLPVKMQFHSMSRSDRGAAMAIYECPYQGCNCRQGWVRHSYTKRPMRLWAKK